MNPRGLGWRWWAALLTAALAIRVVVAFVFLGAMPMMSDAHDYFALAMHFAAGDSGGAFYWPPGESLFLAAAFRALGATIVVARLMIIAASMATLVLVVLLGRELAGDAAAKAAGWMAAVYMPSVMLCGQTYSQHLAALCLAAIAYFGLRAAREKRLAFFAATGVALGIGCLTRPSTASVVPVIAFAWAWLGYRDASARRVISAGAVAAACISLACITPVCTYDALKGAGFTVSTNNERNLFLGNNPYTPDYKTSHLGQRSLDELEPDARNYLESYYHRADEREAMQHAAFAYMAEHPLRTSLRTLNRTTSFWGFDYLASREIQKWRGYGTAASLPLLALEAGSYLTVATLALIALFALRGVGSLGWRVWLVALALAYEIPYTLAFSGGTYHFPVMPLILPIAALPIIRPRETWRRLRASRAAWLALFVFAVVQGQYAYYAVSMSG